MAAYIKFDGIDGEVVEKDHDKWVEILSCSQVVHQPGAGAAGSARNKGSAVFEDILIRKLGDKSTAKILGLVAKGDRVKTIEIHFCTSTKKGQQAYLTYKLSDVLISSYSCDTSCKDRPQESMALNFAKIEFNYKEVKEGGELGAANPFGWDVNKDQAI